MKRISKGKHLSPKKMDKESKSIQSGRAAKGGKTKMLPRISKTGKKYPGGKIEKKESNIK